MDTKVTTVIQLPYRQLWGFPMLAFWARFLDVPGWALFCAVTHSANFGETASSFSNFSTWALGCILYCPWKKHNIFQGCRTPDNDSGNLKRFAAKASISIWWELFKMWQSRWQALTKRISQGNLPSHRPRKDFWDHSFYVSYLPWLWSLHSLIFRAAQNNSPWEPFEMAF